MCVCHVVCLSSCGCDLLLFGWLSPFEDSERQLLVGGPVSSHVFIDHVVNTYVHHGPRSETGLRSALSQ